MSRCQAGEAATIELIDHTQATVGGYMDMVNGKQVGRGNRDQAGVTTNPMRMVTVKSKHYVVLNCKY